jgi:hypothetical protein
MAKPRASSGACIASIDRAIAPLAPSLLANSPSIARASGSSRLANTPHQLAAPALRSLPHQAQERLGGVRVLGLAQRPQRAAASVRAARAGLFRQHRQHVRPPDPRQDRQDLPALRAQASRLKLRQDQPFRRVASGWIALRQAAQRRQSRLRRARPRHIDQQELRCLRAGDLRHGSQQRVDGLDPRLGQHRGQRGQGVLAELPGSAATAAIATSARLDPSAPATRAASFGSAGIVLIAIKTDVDRVLEPLSARNIASRFSSVGWPSQRLRGAPGQPLGTVLKTSRSAASADGRPTFARA